MVILIVFLLLSATTLADELRLPPSEQESVYLALESINPSTNWRQIYTDDFCLSAPHGIICDQFIDSSSNSTMLRIAELNFGFVSDYSSNPSCSSNSTLPSLHSFLFLRKVFFYHCFFDSKVVLDLKFLNDSASNIEQIVFINNPALYGRISGVIGKFHNLKRLIITNSAISGSVPAEIGNLRNLNELVLARNRIGGLIPYSIGNLKNLMVLDLSGNHISSSVPTQVGNLRQLIKLDLSSNRIFGAIPNEINFLKSLEFLDLSQNELTGGVPTAIGELVGLKEVYLSGNKLGGEIPEIWENLKGIMGIGISNNGLVGNIPASMGLFLEKLCYLGLDGNLLEGEVPEQFMKLESTAGEINLANNRLRGRLPFSASFVSRLGGKLKVGGNVNLCLGEELVGGRKGGLGNLEECEKGISHSALSTSSSSFMEASFMRGLFLVMTFGLIF